MVSHQLHKALEHLIVLSLLDSVESVSHKRNYKIKEDNQDENSV